MAASSPKKRIVLLGATGSIGESTLRVIAAHRDRLELVGIASQRNHRRLAEIARQFGVRHVALHDPEALQAAKADPAFPTGTRFHGGLEGLSALASLPEADTVLIAVVGTAGLQPALTAIAAKKTIALASKEILVMAGKFVMAAAHASGSRLLPVDSEHNAVFQCLEG
ncbi:MAG TPA: Gfo/Idh/MocA family oxidoreductase, partial [Lacunisphaera sp.]